MSDKIQATVDLEENSRYRVTLDLALIIATAESKYEKHASGTFKS